MLRTFAFAIVLTAAAALAASAQSVGQTPPQGRPAATAQPGAQHAQAGSVDHAIATCVALGNQEEIALAQFAASKAKQDKVKQFAQMIQRDHTAALQKLYRAMPQAATWNLELRTAQGGQAATAGHPGYQPGGAQQAGAPATGPQEFGQTGVQPAGSTQPIGSEPSGADAQMVAWARSVSQQCLQLTEQELEQAEDFDACYIGQQVAAHIGMLAKLKGSEPFASAELRPVLAEAQQTVQGHLAKARELAKELKSDERSGEHAAQRDSDARR